MVFPQQEAIPPPASPSPSLGTKVRLEMKAEQLELDGEGEHLSSPKALGGLGAGVPDQVITDSPTASIF